MKRFVAIILALIIALSVTACSADKPTNGFDKGEVVYTGEFTITKLENYHELPTGWSYLMCIKSGDVGLMIKVRASEYLKYEVGDVVSGEVRCDNKDYMIQLSGADDWFYAIETMGLKN